MHATAGALTATPMGVLGIGEFSIDRGRGRGVELGGWSSDGWEERMNKREERKESKVGR